MRASFDSLPVERSIQIPHCLSQKYHVLWIVFLIVLLNNMLVHDNHNFCFILISDH